MSLKNNLEKGYGLSELAYSYGYVLRLKYASFMEDTTAWFSNHCMEFLPPKTQQILSLGCGAGIFDLEMIKKIQKIPHQNQTKLDFTGLDFSKTDLERFRQSILNESLEIESNISLRYQKFEPSTKLGKHFDLITMVHFLHSFKDVRPIIKHAITHLNSDGKLLIIQQKKQGILKLRNEFLDIFGYFTKWKIS